MNKGEYKYCQKSAIAFGWNSSKRGEMKIRHMKWKRLLRKHKTEKKESLDKVNEEFKKKYQLIRNDCLLTEEHKTNAIKIKYLEQMARNSTIFGSKKVLM